MFLVRVVAVVTLLQACHLVAAFRSGDRQSPDSSLADGSLADSDPHPVGTVDLGAELDGALTDGSGVLAQPLLGRISASQHGSCAIDVDGAVHCWGGHSGPTYVDSNSRFLASGGGAWLGVAIGGNENAAHICAIDDGGLLFCWGDDIDSQLGLGDGDQSSATPQRVDSPHRFFAVSNGHFFACAVRQNGTLWCWGKNTAGQLGLGHTDRQTRPAQVGSFDDWFRIAAGRDHVCGLRDGGSLYCWGNNSSGQIAISPTVQSQAALPQALGRTYRQVTAGENHSCAISATRRLWCWGDNTQGQLGSAEGDPGVSRRVGTAQDWIAVSAGGAHTCGIRGEGRLYCWGANDKGQLGLGRFSQSEATPTRVGLSTNWRGIACGGFHCCGSTSDGGLYCWGGGSHRAIDPARCCDHSPDSIALSIEMGQLP